MGSLITFYYIGLFIFAINGLIMLGMINKRRELKGLEEELIRMILKIRMHNRRR